MRRLAPLLAVLACALLWSAAPAAAATPVTWCGTDRWAANRTPDVDTGSAYRIHVVYAIPSDVRRDLRGDRAEAILAVGRDRVDDVDSVRRSGVDVGRAVCGPAVGPAPGHGRGGRRGSGAPEQGTGEDGEEGCEAAHPTPFGVQRRILKGEAVRIAGGPGLTLARTAAVIR